MSMSRSLGAEAVLCKHWAHGSAGIEELAHKVVAIAEGGSANFAPLYPDEMALFGKIETIAKKIYRAGDVIADKSVRDQLKAWEDMGYGKLPVCIAKTQYSFTTDPNVRGAPTGFDIPVREVRLSAGAGFIVAICGEIMTMPGLPKVPSSRAHPLQCGGADRGAVLSKGGARPLGLAPIQCEDLTDVMSIVDIPIDIKLTPGPLRLPHVRSWLHPFAIARPPHQGFGEVGKAEDGIGAALGFGIGGDAGRAGPDR